MCLCSEDFASFISRELFLFKIICETVVLILVTEVTFVLDLSD